MNNIFLVKEDVSFTVTVSGVQATDPDNVDVQVQQVETDDTQSDASIDAELGADDFEELDAELDADPGDDSEAEPVSEDSEGGGAKEGSGEIPKDVEEKIKEYVRTHDNLDDSEFHDYVEGLGVDPHEAEEVIYRYVRELKGE